MGPAYLPPRAHLIPRTFTELGKLWVASEKSLRKLNLQFLPEERKNQGSIQCPLLSEEGGIMVLTT